MKNKVILTIILIVIYSFTGCDVSDKQTEGKQEQNVEIINPSQTENSTENAVNISNQEYVVENTTYFKMISSEDEGNPFWFNKWGWGDVKDFYINKVKYDNGLGMDGYSAEGYDAKGFASIKYKILDNKFKSFTGVFGFDDSTKLFADSKLTVFIDNNKVYESITINSQNKYTEVNIPIPQNSNEVAFRIETTIVKGEIPKIVLADIKAKK